MQKFPRTAILHLPLILYPQSSIPALAYPFTHIITLTHSMALLALNSNPVTIQPEGVSQIYFLWLSNWVEVTAQLIIVCRSDMSLSNR